MIREEDWKPIKGYEGLYNVSDTGKVFSIVNNRNLKPYDKGHGYKSVCLSCRGKSDSYKIHRLVAEAFIPNTESKPQVNHINGDKTDNRVENLEWVTASENVQHAWDNGLANKQNPKLKENLQKACNSRKRPVAQYTLDGWLHNIFESATEAARYLGDVFKQGNIRGCCEGKRKIAYGYKWKYTNGGIRK